MIKVKKFVLSDCSGCLNGSFGCSRECFTYDCDPSTCDFIDEDLFCKDHPRRKQNSNEDIYDENYDELDLNENFSDICSSSTKQT